MYMTKPTKSTAKPAENPNTPTWPPQDVEVQSSEQTTTRAHECGGDPPSERTTDAVPMRMGQVRDWVEHVPTAKELLELRLFFLLFLLLLRLIIYVDDLGLTGGLLLNHAFHNNDVVIVVVGVAHLGHADRHRYGRLCWVVCGCKHEQSGSSEKAKEHGLQYSRGGGLTTSLCMVGIEAGSVLTVMVAMFGWEC